MFNFCQKELAPHAEMIDKLDDFPQREDFWKKLGDEGKEQEEDEEVEEQKEEEEH